MKIQNVLVEQLDNWLSLGEAVLVDVREIDEFRSGHIKEAIHMPLADIKTMFIDYLKLNPEAYQKKIVMQCRSGKRSMSACEIIASCDTKLDLYNLEGGIMAWNAFGMPLKI